LLTEFYVIPDFNGSLSRCRWGAASKIAPTGSFFPV